MSSPLGPQVQTGFEGSAGRDSTGLGNAWGTHGGSFIRSIFNAVLPVSVVERWYGEIEGSLFGLTAGVGGLVGHRPSVEFFSERVDWELHKINVWYPTQNAIGGGGPLEYRVVTSLFTAPGNFNPIAVAPTAEFGPQLVTNTTFTQGAVRGQGGHSLLNNPNGLGYTLSDAVTRVGVRGSFTIDNVSDVMGRSYVDSTMNDQPIAWDKHLENQINFDRPLRIKRGRRLTIQLQMETLTTLYSPGFPLQVSILYNELPNPRGSYMTP